MVYFKEERADKIEVALISKRKSETAYTFEE